MNHRTSILCRRNIRAYAAAFISYLMLAGQVAPLALAAAPRPRTAPAAPPTSARPFGAAPQPAAAFDTGGANPPAPAITATKVDSFPDPNNDGKADPGATITYTVTIQNTGTADATGVQFNDTVDAHTSLVAGSVHAQPLTNTDSYTTVANTLLEVGVTASGSPSVTASGSVYDNDSQPNPAGGTDALQFVSNTTPAHGTVTFDGATGHFSYLPNVGYVGADSFTYTMRNSNAASLTDTATVNITVGAAGAGPANVIWYVDNSYTGANGASDGRSTRPFTSLTPVNGAGGAGDSDAAGDIIYLFTGNAAYTTGLQLENTEQLIGNGVALVVNTFTLRAAGTRPTLGNSSGSAITLASGNTVTGLNTGTTSASGAAITGSSFGTATVNNAAVGSGAARALDLSTGTLAITLDSVTSSGAGTGINLSNTGGTLTVSNATSVSNAVGINVAGASFPTVNFSGGLSVTSTAGAGIVATGGTFNIAGTTNTISATGGPAVDLSAVSLGTGATFSSVSSSGSTTSGLKFTNVTGAFAANGGSIGTATGNDIDINGGAGDITYAGSDTNTTARSVSVQNRTGGTVTLSGSINDTGTGILVNTNTGGTVTFSSATKTLNTGANPAVSLTTNTGATVNFTGGGLAITTTSGAGFNATGGGTVNVTGTGNTISSGTGTALSVANTQIGSSGLTFQSISTSGAANGINLNSTGTGAGNGGLTVTGNGSSCTLATTTCTGGSIQSSTGAGILLNTTKNVSLSLMKIQNSGTDGINATSVNGFTLNTSIITDTAGVSGDEGIEFINTSGTVSITNSAVSGSPHHNISFTNTNTNLTAFNMTGTTLQNNLAGTGADGLLFVAAGTSVITAVTITGCTFSGNKSTGIQPQSQDTANIQNFTIGATGAGNGNTFSGNNAGIDADQSQASSITFNVVNNTFNNQRSNAINAFSATASTGGTITGKIQSNIIGTAGVNDSGSAIGGGIRVVVKGGSTGVFTVDSNTVREVPNGRGIDLEAFRTASGNGGARFKVTNNTVARPSGTNQSLCGPANTPCPLASVWVSSDNETSTGNETVCSVITGNTAYDPTSYALGGEAAYYLQENTFTGPSTHNTEGTNANVATQITSTNTVTNSTSAPVIIDGGVATVPAGTCGTFPTEPLTFSGGTTTTSGPVVTQQSTTTTTSGGVTSRPFVSPRLPVVPAVKTTTTTRTITSSTSTGGASSVKPAATSVPKPRTIREAFITNGAGGSLSVNIGTLHPTDSVTIVFQVTVDDPFTGAQPQVSNQGTVSGTNFSNVLTDDPAAGGPADPTVTLINATNIRVNDAAVAEPSTGTAQMLFTVALSNPAPASGLSVSYATANDLGGTHPATGGASCDGTADYVTTSGTATVPAGSRLVTIPVTVCADAVSGEFNETLLLSISNQSSGNITRSQATGTITQGNAAGTFIISELRTRGPAGDGDDFVELYYNNTTDNVPLTINDPSGGYGVFKMGADCNSTPVLIGTIPNGTVIPARGHYLLVGSQYSLANYGGTGAAAGDLTMTSDIEDDHNIGVFSTADVNLLSSATRLDSVGFGTNTGGICELLREGTNLPAVTGTTTEHSFFRAENNFVNFNGNPKDTNDNAADFLFADTAATIISGVQQRLGAPGPENKTSPIKRDPATGMDLLLLDRTVSKDAAVNRSRDFTPNPSNNSQLGTMTIRRRVVNNTGSTVTRLRFRIVEMTTGPQPAGTADLRALTSVDELTVGPINDPATCASTGTPTTTPCTVTVKGTTLEQPPTQNSGGGYNSTLSVTLPGGGLANGASIDVGFKLGVQQTGTFRFFLKIEALP